MLIGFDGEKFEAYFWFVGWAHIALGVSVCVTGPNIELHVPFGFIRIGWRPPPQVIRAAPARKD